jgi:hypothetical protein
MISPPGLVLISKQHFIHMAPERMGEAIFQLIPPLMGNLLPTHSIPVCAFSKCSPDNVTAVTIGDITVPCSVQVLRFGLVTFIIIFTQRIELRTRSGKRGS